MSSMTEIASLSSFLGSKSVTVAEDLSEESTADRVFNLKSELDEILGSRIAKFRPDIPGERFNARMCPAQLENGEWIILVVSEYKNHSLVDDLKEKVALTAGIKYSPTTYTVMPSLLLTMRGNNNYASGKELSKEDVTIHKAAFHEVIAWGIRNRVSDVHFIVEKQSPQSNIKFHIDGIYVAPERWVMPTAQMLEILQVAWQDSKGGGSPLFNPNIEQQCRVEAVVDGTSVMGRWATLAADRGPCVTLRLLKTDEQTTSKTLTAHGYAESQVRQLDRAQTSEGGAIILAGVVGSGKSTTIGSLIDAIPPTRKVVTIEDPVEYRLKALQNTISRSLEDDENNVFNSKMMVFKRQAVQDIMLGEIRDIEGGKAFMEALGMGTNLYTTVHAKSAMQIPERLSSVSVGVPLDFLASPGNLNLLVFQALLPLVCKTCAKPLSALAEEGGVDIRGVKQTGEYWKNYIGRIESLYAADTSGVKIRNHEGCSECVRNDIPELNGFKDRTVVAEMIEPNADRRYLRLMRENDFLGAQEHLESLERTAYDDPNMDNKSLMECAVYKMLKGQFDPRIVESRTMSFATVERIRGQVKKS